jgi:hypothetical protein
MHQHRSLADFARWFLKQPIGALRPPLEPIWRFVLGSGAEVYGCCIFRAAPYQVEMFTFPATPGRIGWREVPMHRHPNVDSLEHHLVGDISFVLNGKRVASDEQISEVDEDGAQRLTGAQLRIRPKDLHGGTVGPRGGVFLSLQRWPLGTVPTSIVLDWAGPAHTSIPE